MKFDTTAERWMTQPITVIGLMVDSINRVHWNTNSIDFMVNYSDWTCLFSNIPEVYNTIRYVWEGEEDVSDSFHKLG